MQRRETVGARNSNLFKNNKRHRFCPVCGGLRDCEFADRLPPYCCSLAFVLWKAHCCFSFRLLDGSKCDPRNLVTCSVRVLRSIVTVLAKTRLDHGNWEMFPQIRAMLWQFIFSAVVCCLSLGLTRHLPQQTEHLLVLILRSSHGQPHFGCSRKQHSPATDKAGHRQLLLLEILRSPPQSSNLAVRLNQPRRLLTGRQRWPAMTAMYLPGRLLSECSRWSVLIGSREFGHQSKLRPPVLLGPLGRSPRALLWEWNAKTKTFGWPATRGC